MEKKVKIGIIILVIIVVVLISGVLLSVKKPEVEVTEIKFRSLSIPQTSVSFYVTLDINNENFIGGQLTKVEADIFIDNEYIGDAYLEDVFEIAPRDASEITVTLKVTNVPIETLDKMIIQVDVDGIAYLSVSFVNFEVPFSETRDVSIG
jgi:LEA14-like dessication related protein